ncbi:hypothetical protein JTB14_003363 [Gonioctena quinquepunctata]|nr:hypothetical protein JTB14_003363 [Gonioctena quinquepunctata]
MSYDFARESLGILASDFGRESLGILPPDFSRESLGILASDFGRESLGILPPDFARESLGILPPDFGKDARTFFNMDQSDNKGHSLRSILNLSEYGRESLESGRESLGILHLTSLDIPEIILSAIPETDEVGNILDTAFLFPSPRKAIFSSISSQNSYFPSFSCDLEEPSKIYSLSKNETKSPDVYSAISDLNKAMMSPSVFQEQRLRINSCPCVDKENEMHSQSDKKFWSTGKVGKTKSLLRDFHGDQLDFDEDKVNILHDSIFIEGNHIAQKIADGSILNDVCVSDILDSTPQPSWPSDLDDSNTKEKDPPKPEADTIFKAIDKMIPEPSQSNTDIKLKTSTIDSTPVKSKDAKEILQNLSEILNSTNRSHQQRSQGRNLISSLAEILCEGPSESRSQNLDDSGHSSFNEPNDCSDKDKYCSYEVLDLSRKSIGEDSRDGKLYGQVLDLSISKLAKNIVDRRLSQSLCSVTPSIKQVSAAEVVKKRNSSVSGLDSSKNKTNNSNSSARSNDSQGSGSYLTNFGGKFKTKTSALGTKKGPLRAVIPVKEMKRNNNITPEKSRQRSSSTLQSKRTSTPINEPKLKPMAASTPTSQQVTDQKDTEGSNSHLSSFGSAGDKNSSKTENSPMKSNGMKVSVKARTNLPSSTLSRQRYSSGNVKLSGQLDGSKTRKSLPSTNTSKEKTNGTGPSIRKSIPKLEQVSLRRNSATEIKNDDNRRLKRSNSVGKETGLMSSLSKVRENLLNSPYFDFKKKSALIETNNNVGGDFAGKGKYSLLKPVNVLPKVKNYGKENLN